MSNIHALEEIKKQHKQKLVYIYKNYDLDLTKNSE
jgi:hypothetical protein